MPLNLFKTMFIPAIIYFKSVNRNQQVELTRNSLRDLEYINGAVFRATRTGV